MLSNQPRMPARYYAQLCHSLEDEGLDTEVVFKAAGISAAQLYAPNAMLSMHQFEQLVAALLAHSGRRDLGFVLGRQIKLSSHEILGYAILTSPTLDYALQLASRYYRLMNPAFSMHYRRGRHTSEVQFRPLVSLDYRAFRFLLETVVVSAHEQIKSLSYPRFPVYDVHVSYEAPAYVELYRQLQPAVFHFEAEGAPGARMLFENEVVSQALPMADPNALKMAETRCDQLIQSTTRSRRMTEWVSMMLRESRHGFPSLAELSHLLNQSPRTLDRHLKREGSRFLELSKSIRYEKARELLASGQLSVSEIAYQLGYNEVASFSRAFKRESGESPSDFMRRVGSSAD